MRVLLCLTAALTLLSGCGDASAPDPDLVDAGTAQGEPDDEGETEVELPGDPDAELDAARVRAELQSVYEDAAALQYASARVDLDEDGLDEVVAYVQGPGVCGSGGCDTVVLAPEGDGYRVAASLGLSRLPVGVGAARADGWRDLYVTIGGGDGRSGVALLEHDGDTYPDNPTTAPEASLDAAESVVLTPLSELRSLGG